MSKRTLSNPFQKLDPNNQQQSQQEQQEEVKVEVIDGGKIEEQGNNSQVEEAVEVTEPEETIEADDEVNFLDLFKEKTNQKTMEQTHQRATFLIDKNLLKQLDKLAKKENRGFKTHFVNYAIQKALKELQ